LQTVTVYYFTHYDIITDQWILSKRPASRVAIEALGSSYRVVEESAKEVNAADLDNDGLLGKENR
jgi:hypothetical protein